MSKEVTYSVVARKNMLKKDDPAKYYAQAQASPTSPLACAWA